MLWNPEGTDSKRTALGANHPQLMARFVEEGATSRAQIFPDVRAAVAYQHVSPSSSLVRRAASVDFIDIFVRAENLRARRKPVLLQLSPAMAAAPPSLRLLASGRAPALIR